MILCTHAFGSIQKRILNQTTKAKYFLQKEDSSYETKKRLY